MPTATATASETLDIVQALTKAVLAWDPGKHPRDRLGRFLEVGDLVRAYSGPGALVPDVVGRVKAAHYDAETNRLFIGIDHGEGQVKWYRPKQLETVKLKATLTPTLPIPSVDEKLNEVHWDDYIADTPEIPVDSMVQSESLQKSLSVKDLKPGIKAKIGLANPKPASVVPQQTASPKLPAGKTPEEALGMLTTTLINKGLQESYPGGLAQWNIDFDSMLADTDENSAASKLAKLMTAAKLGGKQRKRYLAFLEKKHGGGQAIKTVGAPVFDDPEVEPAAPSVAKPDLPDIPELGAPESDWIPEVTDDPFQNAWTQAKSYGVDPDMFDQYVKYVEGKSKFHALNKLHVIGVGTGTTYDKEGNPVGWDPEEQHAAWAALLSVYADSQGEKVTLSDLDSAGVPGYAGMAGWDDAPADPVEGTPEHEAMYGPPPDEWSNVPDDAYLAPFTPEGSVIADVPGSDPMMVKAYSEDLAGSDSQKAFVHQVATGPEGAEKASAIEALIRSHMDGNTSMDDLNGANIFLGYPEAEPDEKYALYTDWQDALGSWANGELGDGADAWMQSQMDLHDAWMAGYTPEYYWKENQPVDTQALHDAAVPPGAYKSDGTIQTKVPLSNPNTVDSWYASVIKGDLEYSELVSVADKAELYPSDAASAQEVLLKLFTIDYGNIDAGTLEDAWINLGAGPIVKNDAAKKASAKKAAAAKPAAVPEWFGPDLDTYDIVYEHPQGSIIVVKYGEATKYKPDGKKSTTSATPDKLAAGHGQWKYVGQGPPAKAKWQAEHGGSGGGFYADYPTYIAWQNAVEKELGYGKGGLLVATPESYQFNKDAYAAGHDPAMYAAQLKEDASGSFYGQYPTYSDYIQAIHDVADGAAYSPSNASEAYAQQVPPFDYVAVNLMGGDAAPGPPENPKPGTQLSPAEVMELPEGTSAMTVDADGVYHYWEKSGSGDTATWTEPSNGNQVGNVWIALQTSSVNTEIKFPGPNFKPAEPLVEDQGTVDLDQNNTLALLITSMKNKGMWSGNLTMAEQMAKVLDVPGTGGENEFATSYEQAAVALNKVMTAMKLGGKQRKRYKDALAKKYGKVIDAPAAPAAPESPKKVPYKPTPAAAAMYVTWRKENPKALAQLFVHEDGRIRLRWNMTGKVIEITPNGVFNILQKPVAPGKLTAEMQKAGTPWADSQSPGWKTFEHSTMEEYLADVAKGAPALTTGSNPSGWKSIQASPPHNSPVPGVTGATAGNQLVNPSGLSPQGAKSTIQDQLSARMKGKVTKKQLVDAVLKTKYNYNSDIQKLARIAGGLESPGAVKSLVRQPYGNWVLSTNPAPKVGPHPTSTTLPLTQENLEFALRSTVANSLISLWAQSSNDSNVRSLAMQEAAIEEFGLKETYPWKSGGVSKAEIQAELAQQRELFRTFLRAMYENTQEWAKANGVKTVRLRRGSKTYVGPVGSKVKVRLRPMSSFSTNKQTANNFGANRVDALVPIEWVVGTAATGFGCQNEYEWVVLGGIHEVRVTS